MSKDRSGMTVRIIPLNSRTAGEARVAGTVAERLALVAELSEMMWTRTGQSRPVYTRATMPVVIVRLDRHKEGA